LDVFCILVFVRKSLLIHLLETSSLLRMWRYSHAAKHTASLNALVSHGTVVLGLNDFESFLGNDIPLINGTSPSQRTGVIIALVPRNPITLYHARISLFAMEIPILLMHLWLVIIYLPLRRLLLCVLAAES
jgi:hypothetical protein